MKKKISNLIIFVSFLFSTIIFFYVIYKSEIYWDGTEKLYYKKYYYFSIFSLLFYFICFFLKKKIKIYVSIFTISVIFTLYLSELFFSLQDNYNNYIDEYKKKKEIYFKETGKIYETKSILEKFNELKKNKKNISILVSPKVFISQNIDLFPFAGISNSQTICCNENGYIAIHDTDRYGFNNPDNEWDEDNVDYILIGDSFIHGYSVNRPFDIASILRLKYGKSVLNLGYPGSGTLLQYATLREYFKKTSNIILFYYNNDLYDLKNELSSKILNLYLDDLNFSQNLIYNQRKINEIVSSTINAEIQNKKQRAKNYYDNKYINFIKLYNLRKIIFQNKDIKPYNEFEKILYLFKEFSNNYNANFYIVYLPGYENFSNKKFNIDNKVLEIIKDLDLNFINIQEKVFNLEKNPLNLFPFGMWGHYNNEGYQKTSDIIYNIIK